MKSYKVSEEYTDSDLELGLIAAIAKQPDLFWTVCGIVPEAAFFAYQELWQQVSKAIESEKAPPVVGRRVNRDGVEVEEPAEPVADLETTARKLADLYRRRLLADLYQSHLQKLRSEESTETLVSDVEARLVEISQAVKETSGGSLQWASDLVSTVITDAEEAATRKQETGSTINGIPTGLSKLDSILGGLNQGLYIEGGPPGAGKTTLALQVACEAAKTVPVVYVTYENAPQNLVLKCICRLGKISPTEVERGTADLAQLRQGASYFQVISRRLAFLEGNGRTSPAMIRGKSLQAMHRHRAEKCLIVIDYLQRMAHTLGNQSLRENVGEVSLQLREISNRLASPILAISSLNRQGYQAGQSNSYLETLKESGDIEYSADVVLFLQEDKNNQSVTTSVKNMMLKVVKNRYGEAGGDVGLTFKAAIGEFRETAWNDPSSRK
jgi:replicative DNA helicase